MLTVYFLKLPWDITWYGPFLFEKTDTLQGHDVNIVSSYVVRFWPHGFTMPQVEVCSGEGQLSRALWSCQFQGKAFDAAWKQVGWGGNLCDDNVIIDLSFFEAFIPMNFMTS